MADLPWLRNDFKAAVVILFRICRPAAVARFVVAIIVDTVKSVPAFWPWPHILKECGEFSPALTHDDASASVVTESAASSWPFTINDRTYAAAWSKCYYGIAVPSPTRVMCPAKGIAGAWFSTASDSTYSTFRINTTGGHLRSL